MVLWFSAFFSLSLAADPRDGAAVLQAVDAIRAPGDTWTAHLDIAVQRPGVSEEHYGFELFVRGTDEALVRFVEPATEKGKMLLMSGDNLWFYTPTTRRPLRISPTQRLQGEVSNGDVARVALSRDYTAVVSAEETVEGRSTTKLELTAKSEAVQYPKVELWVEVGTDQPVLGKFYALSGRLLKTAWYEDVQEVAGKKRPMALRVLDGLQPDKVTRMQYTNVAVGPLDPTLFERDALLQLDLE